MQNGSFTLFSWPWMVGVSRQADVRTWWTAKLSLFYGHTAKFRVIQLKLTINFDFPVALLRFGKRAGVLGREDKHISRSHFRVWVCEARLYETYFLREVVFLCRCVFVPFGKRQSRKTALRFFCTRETECFCVAKKKKKTKLATKCSCKWSGIMSVIF